MGNTGILVLSGYNMRAIIAFIRVCHKHQLPYYIIATTSDDMIFKTNYAKKVIYTREDKSMNNLIPIFNKVKELVNIEKAYIVPSTEYLNRYLLTNREILHGYGIEVLLPDEDLYSKVSDKYLFHTLCIDNKLEVPKIYNSLEEIKYPFVVKAKNYRNFQGKPFLIYKEEDFIKFRTENNHFDFFYEEYIEGASYYLLYYFKKNGSYLCFSQKNLIQQNAGRSIIAAVSSNIHKENISQRYVELFNKLGFQGLVMVEVRKRDDHYIMIEANPRLWGPSQLFVDCKIPLFEAYLEDMGFPVLYDCSESSQGIYFWSNGFSRTSDENFFDYDLEQLQSYYELFIEHDIYNRDDTMQLFLEKNYDNQ